MNNELEAIRVIITTETSGFNKGIKDIKNQLSGLEKVSNKTTAKISNSFSKVFKGITLTAITAGLIKLGKAAVEAASDLEEVQNVVDVAFGEASAEIDRFAKNASAQFGLSEYQAKKMASTFMAMSNGMGIASEAGKKMSVQLTGLAADMASFYNVSTDIAETALSSVFTGETESLKKFGIVLTEANLSAYALSKGITKAYSEMSQAEKVTLRYNYVLNSTANAQNDFARTTNSWANQLRLLSQQWTALKANLGSIITQVLAPIVKWLNTVLAYINAIISAFKKVFNIGTSSKNNSITVSAAGAGTLADNIDTATSNAKKLKKQLAGFDELNVLNEEDEDTGSPLADIGSAGYEVGSYFDVDGLNDIDTSEFENKMVAAFENIKDKWDDLTKALEENTNTLKDIFDWPTILSIGGLTAAAGLISSLFGKEIKDKVVAWLALMTEQGFNPTKWTVFKQILDTIKATLAGISPIAAGVAGAVAAITLAFVDCWHTLEGFKETVVDFWNTNITPMFEGFKALVIDLWDNHLKVMFDSIVNMITSIIEVLETLWNAIKPILAWIGVAVGALVSSVALAIGDLLVVIVDFIADVITTLTTFVSLVVEFINGLVQTIWTTIKNSFTNIINWLKSWISALIKNAQDAWNGIKKIFEGIITFIKGVFTGNWKQAWEGIKQIITGVFDVIVARAKAKINIIIGLFNGLVTAIENIANGIVNALNRIQFSFSIPSWVPFVGGKSFQFGLNLSPVSIPKVPYLAEGGVLTAPTLAMMGEYPGAMNNPEIVTPENKMREVFNESNMAVVKKLEELINVVDSKEFKAYISNKDVGKAAVNYINQQARIMGGSLI